MDYEITEKKLKEMHLSKLADEYNRQCNDITYALMFIFDEKSNVSATILKFFRFIFGDI